MKSDTGSSSARRGCVQQDKGSATTDLAHKGHQLLFSILHQ